jgi:hypothetical protein
MSINKPIEKTSSTNQNISMQTDRESNIIIPENNSTTNSNKEIILTEKELLEYDKFLSEIVNKAGTELEYLKNVQESKKLLTFNKI